jgi:putative copper resistance protein D
VADTLSVLLRALSLVLMLQAAGIALFVAIFKRWLAGSSAAIRWLGRWSAMCALVAVMGHFALEAARMAGELSGIGDWSLQRLALTSPGGAAFAMRLLGLFGVAVGLRGEGRGPLTVGVLGAVLTAVAFAVTGHSAVHAERWFLGPLLTAHVLIVAFWFGALTPLYLVSLRQDPHAVGPLVQAFTAAATWLVPGILIAGVALTVALVPGAAAFRQPYGQLLILKFVGFAVLMVLAAMNKWRLGPAISRGDGTALVKFRRSVAAEAWLIVGVLAATAVMTTFFSPD